jgi:hypothetical protein
MGGAACAGVGLGRDAVKTSTLAPLFVAFCLLTGGLTFAAADVGAADQPYEEFVGPFTSWRQVQCTGLDDTAMLQNELDALGRGGSVVLYIKPGTCRITRTLRLGQGAGGADGIQNVTVLGHDPADTRIVWAGAAGTWQRMIEVNGVGHSRFGRLTWDGGGAADIVYFDATSDQRPYFPTGNRHEDEVFQNLRPGGGVAFYVGAESSGVSESEYIRCKFMGPMQAGIFLVNANVLNHWVWDSLFQNVQVGVTNAVPGRPGGAGGDWGVNRSVFLNNASDLAIGNAQGFFSSRWNYSRGAEIHVLGGPSGRVAAAWTSQGETVLDVPVNPISVQNVGPLGVLDGFFRGGKSMGMIGVEEGYCNDDCSGDLWALGNTFSNTSPHQYAIPFPSAGRVHVYMDDRLGQTINDPGPPALPVAPRPSTARIIEASDGDIAAALARAGSSDAIVHIPHGRYDIRQTLEVGPNVILTGDGYGATQLHSVGADPILHLAGPSHAVVRDLSLQGWDGKAKRRIATGIVIDNADQNGGLIHAEHSNLQRSDVGWEVANLSRTVVNLLDDQNGANTHVDEGGANPSVDYKVSNARLHIFNGAGAGSDAMYELHGGEIVSQTHYSEGNPSGSPATLVAPNSSGTLVIDGGSFAPTWGGIDTSTFSGLFTLTNFTNSLSGNSTTLTARRFGKNSLVMGLSYGSPTEAAPPTFSGTPYALWLPRRANTHGSDLVAERQTGISDAVQFTRDHLAPLRAARPLPVTRRPAGVTDVRLYRIGGELLKSGVRVTGAARP